MSEMEKVAVLQNEVEAELVDMVLTQQQIPHVMRCYHDSALDGLFQEQSGWGHVEAPAELHTQVQQMVEDVRREQSTALGDEDLSRS